MKVDGTTKGSSLSANKLTPVDPKRTRALVKSFCKNVQSLARELNELAGRFAANKFVIRAGERKKYSPNDLTDEAVEMLCDTVWSIFYDCVATASVLDRAISTLVGFTPLMFYIQWPICAGKFRTADPLKPWFELWRRGVTWRFVSGNVVEVFTP